MSIGNDLLRFSDHRPVGQSNLAQNTCNRGSMDPTTERIVSLYRDGATLNQLAVKFHKRNTTIRRILTDNGIRILGVSEGWRKSRGRTLNESYFDVIDTPEKAYVLGFIYADGNIYINPRRNNETTFQMALQQRDIEVFEFIKKQIGSNHPLCSYKNAHKLTICNRRFCHSLMAAGVTPRKSLTLEFPSEQIVPKHLRAPFILGYFDGDGSVSVNDERGYWSMMFIGTWQFLMAILQEFDDVLSIRPQLPYKQNNTPENVFKITWGGRHRGAVVRNRAIWKIYHYLYSGHNVPGLARKRERLERVIGHYAPLEIAA